MAFLPPMPSETIRLPAIPLSDAVVFPRAISSVFVSRPKGMAALEAALASGEKRAFFALAAKPPKGNDAAASDATPASGEHEDAVRDRGVVGEILQVTRGQEGAARILVEGLYEAVVTARDTGADHARVSIVAAISDAPLPGSDEAQGLSTMWRAAVNAFRAHCELVETIPDELVNTIAGVEDATVFLYQAANQAQLGLEEKQSILEAPSLGGKIALLMDLLVKENEFKTLENKILDQARSSIGQSQREYFLNEQLKVIERELGVGDDDSDLEEIEKKLETVPLSEEARAKVERELRRLEKMPPVSPEATVARTYIDTILELPWGIYTDDDMDLARSQAILDEDHFGLEKIKERVIEFLAVAGNVGAIRGPILCLVGPPGVGKTSLAKSVARALGRKFVRLALGGVRDEADIRGHPPHLHRLDAGAHHPEPAPRGEQEPGLHARRGGQAGPRLPRRPLQRAAGGARPGAEPRVPRPLSGCALRPQPGALYHHRQRAPIPIPPPLRDRMEIIQLSSYTEDEKVNIATKFLFPKQRELHGVEPGELAFPVGSARFLVNSYTREAGVRSLERNVAKLCRKNVRERMSSKERSRRDTLTQAKIREMLGPPRYKDMPQRKKPEVGVATGLAWTEAGGEMLPVESAVMPGQGKLTLTLTGKLGEVMQESARAALAYIRANWSKLDVDPGFYLEKDLHVHVPEGAIPKDGPSAGVALVTSMVSALSGHPARQDVAMTGEITLRGDVLRIGGLKEKALAARRNGVKAVIIPADNKDELGELPASVRDSLTFHPVRTLAEAMRVVFSDKLPVAAKQKKGGAPKAQPTSERSKGRQKPAEKHKRRKTPPGDQPSVPTLSGR
jgi:ATP-dependent Lon protease